MINKVKFNGDGVSWTRRSRCGERLVRGYNMFSAIEVNQSMQRDIFLNADEEITALRQQI